MKKRRQILTMISHKKAQEAQERFKVKSYRPGVFCAFLRLLMIAVVVLVPLTAHGSQAEVRSTVQGVFEQLKSHNYSALYDVLPASSRSRMSRERFVGALQRAQGFYQLDRMEIGAIKVSGNLAVVDTVLFGRIVNPIQAEGKIVAQQYLIREEGKWRVATGDQSAVKQFLASNPAFGKGFKIRAPQIFIKQNDKWIQFNAPRAPRKQT